MKVAKDRPSHILVDHQMHEALENANKARSAAIQMEICNEAAAEHGASVLQPACLVWTKAMVMTLAGGEQMLTHTAMPKASIRHWVRIPHLRHEANLSNAGRGVLHQTLNGLDTGHHDALGESNERWIIQSKAEQGTPQQWWQGRPAADPGWPGRRPSSPALAAGLEPCQQPFVMCAVQTPCCPPGSSLWQLPSPLPCCHLCMHLRDLSLVQEPST